MSDENRWHIAYVRTGDELSLAEKLKKLAIKTYIPTCKRQIRRRGRKATRTVAAWPGYLLIKDPGPIDDPRLYHFLMDGDERAALTDEHIEGFRLMERLGAFQTHAESERLLGIGEAVKVATGLLKGLGGYVHGVWGGKAEVGGGDFPKSVRVPVALLLPEKPVD